MRSWRRFALSVGLGVGWGAALLAGCGDDGSPSPAADAAIDSSDGQPDAAPPEASTDAPPVPFDAGPPPACDLEPVRVELAPAFDGDRDADPDAFVQLGPGGPWAFVYGYDEGLLEERTRRIEARLVDAAGAEVANPVLAEVQGSGLRLQHARAAPAAGGLFVVWSRVVLDESGAIESSEVRHAGVADDGVVVRPAATIYADAAVPRLASDPPDDVWVMRSDFETVGAMTVVTPYLQHLDAVGDPVAPERDISSVLRVEATDLKLRPAADGLKLVYRVPPSTAVVVPFDRSGGLVRSERPVSGVPLLEDVAITEDRIAIVWSRRRSGVASVGLVVTDGLGREVSRSTLDERESPRSARVAVVPAWPGFVVAWRTGAGADARLMGAGLTPDGEVRVPPTELMVAPDGFGRLFATVEDGRLTFGERTKRTDGTPRLAFSRACIPGAGG